MVSWAVLAATPVSAQPPPPRPAAPPRVVSPEVAADRNVTFRLRAPQAQSVRLTSGGDIPQIPPNQALELEKGADGIWQLTIGPVDPGAYRYAFVVDGLNVVDPAQANVSPSNDNVWSLFTVPGAKFMDTRDVPHGAVAEVPYFSKSLGKWRRMHVYTPPGYGLKQQRYPVLYLLHGAFDSDASWPTVGRAGDILDNLSAEGDAVPMIVVMP
ncbi:MAG TPA: alpha/beta hydrolase-fold protein, partial [Gammaproteobacteria bacterium]|nr:alpha/beta hydrolase-fold protein [Gammaproteobacteria bacterium]